MSDTAGVLVFPEYRHRVSIDGKPGEASCAITHLPEGERPWQAFGAGKTPLDALAEALSMKRSDSPFQSERTP